LRALSSTSRMHSQVPNKQCQSTCHNFKNCTKASTVFLQVPQVLHATKWQHFYAQFKIKRIWTISFV